MYDFLEGVVAHVGVGRVTLDVGGVGYLIQMPGSSAARVGALGVRARVWTHLVVTDGEPRIFGFAEMAERELFRLVTSVNGVGPSTGLAILSALSGPDLVRALASGEEGLLRSVRGVGAKTAGRLIMELKDAASRLELAPGAAAPSAARDAVDGLVALGYARPEAERAVAVARKKAGETASPEMLIKAALAAERGR